MKRGPKTGKANQGRRRVAVEDLGDPPAELKGAGRELWLDAVAHWRDDGRAFRVYRHALLLTCRLLEQCDGDAGINRMDAARRWLHELRLTPTTTDGATEVERGEDENGRARILALIARKTAS